MIDTKVIVSSLSVVLFILVCGCSGRSKVDPKGYMKYIHNIKNGMVQEKVIDNTRFGAIYLTPEAMVIMELKDSTSKEKFEKTLPEYQGLQYVRFNIQAVGNGHIYNATRQNDNDPEDIEKYLNLNAQKDFFMVSGNDTSKCVLYSFSKTYGLAANWEIMLGFEKKDTISDIYLKYDDKISDSGLLSFRYKRKDVLALPIIQFEL